MCSSSNLAILPPADAAANLGFFVSSTDKHFFVEKIFFQSEILIILLSKIFAK